jgi:hypothetical protein
VNVFNQIIYALFPTYKISTTGDIPATEVLIEGVGTIKQLSLMQENNVTDDWFIVLVLSKATHQVWI